MARFKKDFSKCIIFWKFNTMIFATIGNDHRDFKRMINLLKLLANELPKEEFIIQSGHSTIPKKVPKNFKNYKFITRKEFENNLLKARFVITHAGAGTLLQCFEKNIFPLVLPRRVEFKEHVNNHQLDILNEFNDQNLCLNIENLEFYKLLEFLKIEKGLLKKNFKLEKKLLRKLKESINQVI